MDNSQKPQTPQPRNIFECINQNIVDLSYDVVEAHNKIDVCNKKLDLIIQALFLQQDNAAAPKEAAGTAEAK